MKRAAKKACQSFRFLKSACLIPTVTWFGTSSKAALLASMRARACYHTDLITFDLNGVGEIGIIGHAVGASFAVLVAEQLFASGCHLLVSVTSAGQIIDNGPPPYFVLIERALRDEGTSYHYLPPETFAEAPDIRSLALVSELFPEAPRHFGAPRSHLDNRCTLPRDRSRDHPCAGSRSTRGRDGSGRLVRLCRRHWSLRDLLRARNECLGTD